MAWLRRRPRTTTLPVVPGGEGYGMSTRAAYGGGTPPQVLRVTTLNDSGAGSLRAALLTAGPRVVVFETSGNIVLTSDIVVTEPYVTLAGQTAPSPGITLQGFGIQWYTHDVLMQHLRVRPGDGPPRLPQTADHDASIVYTEQAWNVVYDHNSLSWAQGKTTEVISPNSGAEVCYWRNLISEALYRAKNVVIDPGQPSSLGMLLASMANTEMRVSVLGNLFAHNADRNPEIHTGVTLQFVNNVVYDWGRDETPYPWASFLYQCEYLTQVAVVGNVYIAGPGPHPVTPLSAVATWGCSGVQVYLADNALEGAEAYDACGGDDWCMTSLPVDLTGLTIRPAADVEGFVRAQAGARPAARDSVDARVLEELATRTGRVIRSQDDVGGWPALAVNQRALRVPDNPHTILASGYTVLEVWLHGYADAVEQASPPMTVLTSSDAVGFDYLDADLATYAVRGFEAQWDGAAYTALTVTGAVLPDTPSGAQTYRLVPPFPNGRHTVAVRACNARGASGAASWAFAVAPEMPPAPSGLRKVPR